MTAADALGLVGGWLFVAFVLAPLMSRAFCTGNAPKWAREWRDVAGALAALRLVFLNVASLGAGEWWVVAIWAHLALAQSVVAGCNVWDGLRRGSRCPSHDSS